MSHDLHTAPAPHEAPQGRFAWYQRLPLYIRILGALALGVIVGTLLGKGVITGRWHDNLILILEQVSAIVLRLLGLLATPLIFIAVVHALSKAKVSGKTATRLLRLLLTNTVVAILIGLLIANVVRPGQLVKLTPHGSALTKKAFDPIHDLLGKIPGNFVDPLQKNEIISVIFLAVAFGMALRVVRAREGLTGIKTIEDVLEAGFSLVMVMLHWIFAIIPLAVFAVVAKTVGKEGVGPLLSMGGFVISVLLALTFQSTYYLLRLRLMSWVSPLTFLKGSTDALTMAFSTASSAATLPVTYSCAKDKIGVREESAGIGIMVGGTFNHDGTALYEAMAALFISQMLGLHLSLGQQLLVVLMSVFASVGAAGIPEAGLVTMLAVFSAVNLPVEYVPFLLPLDWFLDRCRTTINVMGDLSVTCILDGKTQQTAAERAAQEAASLETAGVV